MSLENVKRNWRLHLEEMSPKKENWLWTRMIISKEKYPELEKLLLGQFTPNILNRNLNQIGTEEASAIRVLALSGNANFGSDEPLLILEKMGLYVGEYPQDDADADSICIEASSVDYDRYYLPTLYLFKLLQLVLDDESVHASRDSNGERAVHFADETHYYFSADGKADV